MAAPDQSPKITIPLVTREPSIHGPSDNGERLVESMNGKSQAECLNAHWSMSLDDAIRKCPAWSKSHNGL